MIQAAWSFESWRWFYYYFANGMTKIGWYLIDTVIVILFEYFPILCSFSSFLRSCEVWNEHLYLIMPGPSPNASALELNSWLLKEICIIFYKSQQQKKKTHLVFWHSCESASFAQVWYRPDMNARCALHLPPQDVNGISLLQLNIDIY